jgi:hypothetical protein
MSDDAFAGLLPVAKRLPGGNLNRKTKRIVIPSAPSEGSVTFVFEPPRVVPTPKPVVKKRFSLVPLTPALLELLPQGILVPPGWLYIGRGPSQELPVYSALVLNVEGISKTHAAVTEFHGKPFVADLGSTNGTRIFRNNEAIEIKEEPTELLASDILWIGSVFFQIVHGG